MMGAGRGRSRRWRCAGAALVLACACGGAQGAGSEREARPLGPVGGASAGGAGATGEPGVSASGWMDSVRPMLALGLVLGVIGAGGLAVRSVARRTGGLSSALGPGGRAPAGVLEVLGRYPVAPGQTLVLLKLERRILLLSQTAGSRWGRGGFETLCEVTDPEEVAGILVRTRDEEGASIAASFRAALDAHDARHDEADARVLGGAGTGGAGGALRRRLAGLRSGGAA